MSHRIVKNGLFAITGLSIAVAPFAATAASAQSYGSQDNGYGQAPGYNQAAPQDGDQYGGYDQAPPQGYDQVPPQGYDQAPPPGYDQGGYGQTPSPGYGNGAPPQGYQNPPPPPAPPGYDGTRPPPPPPGYQAAPDEAIQRGQDQRYTAYAEQWARDNCVKAHGDTGAGALIGGAIGAIIGSGFGGHGAGALAGAAVGAAGGAVVANSSGSNTTSPGCPPGFVVRREAPAFAYGGYGGQSYVYAAPGWYQPWVYYGGAWTYRPYPYHVWYYRHYGYYGPRGYYHRGPYRRRW
jgi:hypothetical protein